jgi:PAS domain S-box-containing protein
MDGGRGESPALQHARARGEATRADDVGMVAGAASGISTGLNFKSMLAIADSLPLMIAYLDRDLVYRFVNRQVADWFELPRSAMIGKSVAEVMGEEAFLVRKPHLEATLAGEAQLFTIPFDHPVRGKLTVKAHYTPHQLDDGSIGGIVLVIQDITEQKAADSALRESEARFRRIADSAPALMWVTRLDRSRDFVNNSYADFLGLEVDEACRFDWREILHPEDHDRIVAESVAGEASLKLFTLEARYRRSDGQYRWMRSVSQPRTGPDGNLAGYIGVATDVTAEKEAERLLKEEVAERTAKLSESEARFRAIFDTVMEVVVLLKPDGTVVEVNKTKAPWRHQDPRESIGRPLWEAPTIRNYPAHIDLLKQGIARAAKGEVFRSEVVMERENFPAAVLDVSIQPVRIGAGDPEYLLFEARDITELKNVQDQLRQSQKMEALGQLTGGIAHDFNNLLTVVVGGLDLIAKQVEEPRLLRYANSALSAAERGARLTGQLLAFSRVQRLEVKPTYVAPLIEEMRPLLRNVLGPGIQKQFDLDPHLMPVMADPTQLEVAVLNVAINARDAMPDGGVLTIATRRLRIEDDPELEPGHYIELAISDTGHGMTPEVVTRAFEPFFTTKEVGKGTGLGLSMVYGMARQSGGSARIDSEEGRGTTVRLFFRRSDEEMLVDTDSRGGQTQSQARAVLSVLVIDDDEDVRQFIVSSLEEYGHRVIAAEDGTEGIAKFAAHRPDVVVLDYIMPGMSGAEVAERILADTPRQPILFVSGYSETDAIRAVAPEAGILAKPFMPAALDEAVRLAAGMVKD